MKSFFAKNASSFIISIASYLFAMCTRCVSRLVFGLELTLKAEANPIESLFRLWQFVTGLLSPSSGKYDLNSDF